jgi:hypothetical protein
MMSDTPHGSDRDGLRKVVRSWTRHVREVAR